MFGFLWKSQERPSAAPGEAVPAVLGAGQVARFQEQDHPFKREFDLEIESWCYGLTRLSETPLPKVVFCVVRELRPMLARALASGYVFNIQSVADRIAIAARGSVEQKAIAFALLAILPEPGTLPLEQKRLFATIVAQVEASHGGAVDRVRQRMSRADQAPANQNSAANP